jgi:hypothetical protein
MKPPRRLFRRRHPIPSIGDLQFSAEELAHFRQDLDPGTLRALQSLTPEAGATFCLLVLARRQGHQIVKNGHCLIDLTGAGRGDSRGIARFGVLPEPLLRLWKGGQA